MVKKEYIFLVGFLISLTFGDCCVFAQEKENKSVTQQANCKERCIKNFNTDLKSMIKDKKAIENMPLLAEYVQCKSASRDNIDVCNELEPWPDRISVCKKYFSDYQNLYGKLFREGKVSSSLIDAWRGIISDDAKETEKILQGMLKGDKSVCGNLPKAKQNNCYALTLLDKSYCQDSRCKETVNYILAVKANDVKKCEAINNNMIRYASIGFISSDEKKCEENSSFVEYRNRYCDNACQ